MATNAPTCSPSTASWFPSEAHGGSLPQSNKSPLEWPTFDSCADRDLSRRTMRQQPVLLWTGGTQRPSGRGGAAEQVCTFPSCCQNTKHRGGVRGHGAAWWGGGVVRSSQGCDSRAVLLQAVETPASWCLWTSCCSSWFAVCQTQCFRFTCPTASDAHKYTHNTPCCMDNAVNVKMLCC